MNRDEEDKEIESLQRDIFQSVATEKWFVRYWRPSIAWLYFATCLFDFIVAPVGWAIIHAATGKAIAAWMPLTLQGAGLYHLAMGAILGVAAWSRGQEKIYGVSDRYSGDYSYRRDEFIDEKKRRLQELKERRRIEKE